MEEDDILTQDDWVNGFLVEVGCYGG